MTEPQTKGRQTTGGRVQPVSGSWEEEEEATTYDTISWNHKSDHNNKDHRETGAIVRGGVSAYQFHDHHQYHQLKQYRERERQ